MVYGVILLAEAVEMSFFLGALSGAGTLLSSSVCKKRMHLEVPFMSSIFFTRFLVCSI